MNLGAPELLIILAVVLLLFGSTRLPSLARSLGQASKATLTAFWNIQRNHMITRF